MKLFIGCGSEIVDEKYLKNSKELVERIASIEGIDLVFGAYDHGLMGTIYHEFLNNNKKIIGITTEKYKKQLDELKCSEKITVKTTMDRAKELYNNSDAILILPGGIGTYTELFCAIEEHRTINDNKLIILYNDNYFYTSIIEELYHLYKEHFSSNKISDLIRIESNQEEIIRLLEEFGR